jgi:hypothetical protein
MVSVRDHDPRLPVVADIHDIKDTKDADALATCGRGLAMVAAVSESWGVRPDGDFGKVVWFTLPTPSSTLAGAARPLRRAVTEKPAHRFANVEHADDLPRPEHAPARSAVVG